MRNFLLVCVASVFLATGCIEAVSTPDVSLPDFVTATLPPSATPAFTSTPQPPTPAPTIAPIPGTTTSEVNVRVEPSTASPSLGAIPAFSSVKVIGKDSSGNWYRVLFEGETGWVRADFIQVNDPAEIPFADADSGGGSGLRGVATRGVNVRSGPGKEFESLGLLNQNDVVTILGKGASGAWMKIEYAASPDGTGWVAAEYLQVENADAIPVIGSQQETDESATLPIVHIAPPDGDSAENPLAVFELSPASARAIQFQGEVSAPEGDAEDWIEFKSQGARISVQVVCDSSGIQVELTGTDGAALTLDFDCGESRIFQVSPNASQRARITPITNGGAVFIRYGISIKWIG